VAVSLASDPIMAIQDAADVLTNLTDEDKLAWYINAASARFLSFTGRSRITSGSVTQYDKLPPIQAPVIWLRAAPVTSITSVKVYCEGVEEETLTSSDYWHNSESGRLTLSSYATSGTEWAYQLVTEYTGGWAASAIPADVKSGAAELIRVMRERAEGRAGVQSVSFEGMSTSYETGSLPESVQGAWQPYRIY